MKKLTSTVFGLGLLGYLGVQYYVLDQVQRVAHTIPKMETAIQFGMRGLFLQLNYKEGTSFLGGEVYPSWDLMTLKGRGLIGHEGYESKYHFVLDDIWDIPDDLTYDELLKVLEERADQGRSIGLIGFDIDHLTKDEIQIDGLHSQLKLMPGKESFVFGIDHYRVEHKDVNLDIKNFNLDLDLPYVQNYYLTDKKPEKIKADFNTKVGSIVVSQKDKRLLEISDWGYEVNALVHDNQLALKYRGVFDQFNLTDADALWVSVKNILQLPDFPNEDNLKEIMKLSQQEGTQSFLGAIDFVLSKSPDHSWEDCINHIDQACEGKLTYKQQYGFSDLGIKLLNSSHINLNEGFNASIEFDRQFEDMSQRDLFIDIQKKKYSYSLKSLKKDPNYSIWISSVQDTLEELIAQYARVDQGKISVDVQNRSKLSSDLTTCALSQGGRCQDLSQNVDLTMGVSWLTGGKLELAMPKQDDIMLQLKGLDGFEIKPAVTYILKKMRYEVTPQLVSQLIIDNGMTLVYKGPGQWLINGHALGDLHLKAVQEKPDLRQHQKKWQRPRA